MDSYEAARAVFTRVQTIEPDHAHKIVGYILLQDQAEKEMIRLAFGPESHIHSVISKAKTQLGLSSNTSSATNSSPSPPPFSPITSPQPLSLPSPRLPHHSFNPSSPSSPSVWSISASDNSVSYADVVNGTSMSPGSGSESPFWEDGSSGFDNNGGQFHRRSCSVNDICFAGDDSSSGFGFKPCLYFSRGFCKNGSACKFVHGEGGFVDSGDNSSTVLGSSSPSKIDAFEQYQQEVLRSKVAQQQRLAASQFMSGVNFPFHKLSFLQREAQRSAAVAALMMGEEFNKLNRFRMGRNDVSEMGYGDSAPGARQIYLTFPADSTFKEEDVSNYFSIFGPVQDVRIPYQQKRMFGFVTFVYPETVKVILAKGNPHFVCDSRVLVKPYKEKGKLPDKKQQFDRSEFSSCSSPSGLDYREPFEMHVGPRMLNNNREMLLRKKLEQEAAWQQALEFQRQRLINLQLVDLKNHHASVNQNTHPYYNVIPENTSEVLAENQGSPTAVCTEEVLLDEVNTSSDGSNGNKEDNKEINGACLLESLEHILPDGLLASPTKSAAEGCSIFAVKPVDVDNGVTISTSTNNDMMVMPLAPTLKSQLVEIHSLSSGHGAIDM